MADKPIKKITRKRSIFEAGKFYVAPVTIGGDTVTIVLPKKVATYFQLDKPEIYWAPVNGVIQLSGSQPQMVIPMLTENGNQFIPQPID